MSKPDKFQQLAKFALKVTDLGNYGEDDPNFWRDLDILRAMAQECLTDQP